MRKMLYGLLALVCAVTLYSTPTAVNAAGPEATSTLQQEKNPTQVFVSSAGKEKRLDNCIFDKGMTYVSINDISKLLNVTPKWTTSTRTVTIEHEVSTITWNTMTDSLKINNKDVKLTARPRIQDDRTYIPLTLLREVYALQYSWNSTANTVTILFGDSMSA